MKPFTDIASVRLNDPTVQNILESGGTAESCVVALANQKQELQARVLELDSIAPKAVTENGKILVWNCPPELIPESRTIRLPLDPSIGMAKGDSRMVSRLLSED